LAALGFLFVSSGRKVVEKKLEERGEELEDKEKSTLWRRGVIYYNIAFPFVITSNVIFFSLTLD
jgi:hypothetical protein